jgi:hypothetical protein
MHPRPSLISSVDSCNSFVPVLAEASQFHQPVKHIRLRNRPSSRVLFQAWQYISIILTLQVTEIERPILLRFHGWL